MPQVLPVSSLINVQVILAAAAAQAQDLNTGLIFGSTDVITTGERARLYYSADAVGADFGLSSPEYLASVAYFSQSPQPQKVYIARVAAVATPGSLVGGNLVSPFDSIDYWKTITAGTLTVSVDGTPRNLTGLNFSAVTSLNGVANVIQLALVAAGAAGATVTYFASSDNFVIKSGTTGTASSVTVTGGTIADPAALTVATGAFSYSGSVADTAVSAYNDAAIKFGQKFYGVYSAISTAAEDLLLASAIEASSTKRTYWVTSQDANNLNPLSTTAFGFQIKALNVKKTGWIHSSTNRHAAASLMARAININYNANNSAITLMYKNLPGVVAESLSASQAAAVKGFNGNVFANYDNGTAIVQYGTMANGDFIDIITGTDWLAVTVQNNLYNLLYTSTTKIPQTDAGQNVLLTAAEQVCAQGVTNGLLAPGVWNNNGFGQLKRGDFMPKGYYLYSAPIDQQLAADRSARKAQPIQIAAKLSGAIHTVDVVISVDR